MKTIAVYSPKGEITKVVQCPEFLFQAQTGVGESSIPFDPDWDPNAFYVYRGKLHHRQELPGEAWVEGTTLFMGGLPQGLTVRVLGEEVVVDADITEVDFEVGGTYEVKLWGLAAYFPRTLTVTVGG